MLHFVTSYMKQNKSREQTLESAQYGLEISFNTSIFHFIGTLSMTFTANGKNETSALCLQLSVQ